MNEKRIRELVKAGALICAEIERLLRADGMGSFDARMQATANIDYERFTHYNYRGFTYDHDDEHVNGELALAAAMYATPPTYRDLIDLTRGLEPDSQQQSWEAFIRWPWNAESFKPELE